MKPILDVCCSSKMCWFDKNNDGVLFGDIRQESHTLCDGRQLLINPDIQFDFRALPFDANSFSLVLFDPPHLVRAGEKSWLKAKYGVLSSDWRTDISQGFSECFRVLKPDGVLVFKWNEMQVPLKELLALTPVKPLFGNRSGKNNNTHWVTFMKPQAVVQA